MNKEKPKDKKPLQDVLNALEKEFNKLKDIAGEEFKKAQEVSDNALKGLPQVGFGVTEKKEVKENEQTKDKKPNESPKGD